MENPYNTRKPRAPRATRFLDVDAWIDSTLYEGGFKAREIWESLTIFFRRFRVSGWRRGIVEVLSECATLGTGGSIVLLMLALPAFDETSKDWQNQGDFAITFLDRYGNEIGQRGIIQRDSVPLDEMPDHVVNAVLATEDRRFFEHFGIDFLGLFRALSPTSRPIPSCRAARPSRSRSPRTFSFPTSARWSARSRKPSCQSGWRPT